MKVFDVLALAFAVTLAAGTEARAAALVTIDDATDNLKVSINGTDVTTTLINGVPPGFTAGGLPITGGLILTGPGCNPGGNQCAVLRWDDPSVSIGLGPGQSYNSPAVLLLEAGGTPGGQPLVSDEVDLTVTNVGTSGSPLAEFQVSLLSDAGETSLFPVSDCTTSVVGCQIAGLETGSLQDVTTLLLTPVNNCTICNLPPGGISGVTVQVISDAVESGVPEPSALLLLAASGLAWLTGRAAWKKRRGM